MVLQSTGESSIPRVPLVARFVSTPAAHAKRRSDGARRRTIARQKRQSQTYPRQKRLSQTLYPRPRPQVNLSTHSSHQSFFLPKLVAALSLTPNAARQCLGCLDFGAARMELLDSRLLLLCCLVVPIVYHVYNRRKERQVIAQYIPFSISKTC